MFTFHRTTKYTSANSTTFLPSPLPILSLIHPHLWGLQWMALRVAPPAANAPHHCAPSQAKGTHMAPLTSPVEFKFGTPAPSSGYRAAPPPFIFSPPSTHTFPDPSTMVFGRQSPQRNSHYSTPTPRPLSIRDAYVRTGTIRLNVPGEIGDFHRAGNLAPLTPPSHARHVMSSGAFTRIKNILHNRPLDGGPGPHLPALQG